MRVSNRVNHILLLSVLKSLEPGICGQLGLRAIDLVIEIIASPLPTLTAETAALPAATMECCILRTLQTLL
jgi:hypothetical protein